MSSNIVDDKSEYCIPFILDHLSRYRNEYLDRGESPPPFFLGLNGVQGAGKTTLVTTLRRILTSPPHFLPTTVLSIDDLYLTHSDQVALASSHPKNPLIQHRGEPSTHDLALGLSVFSALKNRQPINIPKYDKSRFNGQGDRADKLEGEEVNKPGEPSVDVVVFEGWCVGFRALSNEEVERKWRDAKEGKLGESQLSKHRLEDLLFVNEALKAYDLLTGSLHAFVHIDAEETSYVYEWRLQQEAALRASKGSGMTDEQVIDFVNGYYPAYELYTENLRKGIYKPAKAGRQLRLIVGRDRRVKSVQTI
ncbi:putative uridine/cytidine kinase [Delitschia confertaspora ATCC 74209]|uniref:Uridine/cytidine kinase n=1 Tax=Delitschia confertaspora ATCC 74209 TaxID=1513339 RepID=A0A9P4JNH1_9PLEO|nr:putative uridine/cytidine kinase [Delitschia confertaspora ATCC 74209]